MAQSLITILATPPSTDLAFGVHQRLKAINIDTHFQELRVITFPDKTFNIEIPESVRDHEVYFFHSLFYPDPNAAFMQLFIAGDALKRASVGKIFLYVPFMPYQRQDRKDKERVPISGKLIWDLIETNKKIERAVTMDMHSEQQQGFADIPVDNFPGRKIFAKYIVALFNGDLTDVVVAAPDYGGHVRARRFICELEKLKGSEGKIGFVSIEKQHIANGDTEILDVSGDVVGKIVLFIDDIIDTAGSMIHAGDACMKRGAKAVYLCASHGVLSKKSGTSAEWKLAQSGFQTIITDSIPRSLEYQKKHPHITIVSIEETMLEVVARSIAGQSFSKIFT